MKFRYLALLPLFVTHISNAQIAGNDLLALNTEKRTEFATYKAGDIAAPAIGRVKAEAGDGVISPAFTTGFDFAIVSPQSKSGSRSATGSGLKYGVEIGAKLPLFHTNYKQCFVAASVFISGFSAKRVFADTAGIKRDFAINSIGVPLTVTLMNMNRKGGILGYYYEAGANVGYVYEAKDGGTDLKKQFNSILVTPHVGVGLCLTMAKRGRFANENALIGIYVADAVLNMVKTDGVVMHALFYGIKYTGIIN